MSSPNPVLDPRCLAHIVRAFVLGALLGLGAFARPMHGAAQTIPGLDSWADATVGVSTRKWVGPRVPFPMPTPRPQASGRIDSLYFPLSVHVGAGVSAERGLGVLTALEQVYPLLSATGWAPTFGDAGQAATGSHDVYVVSSATHGAGAAIDASEPFGSYDGARAFALVDARVPSSHVAVCATEALLQAYLYELDPAEAESVRRASAAYVAYLAHGVAGCDDEFAEALDRPREAPFGDPESARGALWLMRLSAREDRQSGTFLRNMWDFARQRTWEGRDLRASPDLLECVAQAVELRHEIFEELAAGLSEQHFLAPLPLGVAPAKPRVVSWSELPEHVWQAEPTIGPLGAMHAWVELEKPRPGEQLRVWSRGELGVRWALVVTRLDKHRQSKGSLRGAVRKNPNGFLVIELDAETTDVLITLANVGDGTPDADHDGEFFDHGAELIVARGNPAGTMPGTTDDPP